MITLRSALLVIAMLILSVFLYKIANGTDICDVAFNGTTTIYKEYGCGGAFSYQTFLLWENTTRCQEVFIKETGQKIAEYYIHISPDGKHVVESRIALRSNGEIYLAFYRIRNDETQTYYVCRKYLRTTSNKEKPLL